jgi:hypothetical protein
MMNKKLLWMNFIQEKQKSNKTITFFLTKGARTRKMYTLMCIIQNMLQYYKIEITDVDLLKPKVMKLTYTRSFFKNINGTIIHFALTLPLNNFLMNSKH